ncbi:hypothetical protein COT29_00625 [Candidatus Micrarchaeota archaeon CG08_land_8_20_14_0_20_59_11]|nr:MAG: hypothetical protein COT29_00625 [Candidatus Micrarchaeota archaeon CG08_land_8_20_14_0_20_59_11]
MPCLSFSKRKAMAPPKKTDFILARTELGDDFAKRGFARPAKPISLGAEAPGEGEEANWVSWLGEAL